ncbi:MAG: kynureninase, partial [Halobacteria archaeon]|nr:kynureninase [Halobacteria archaeon]
MQDDYSRDEEYARNLDEKDPLAGFGERFCVPEGLLYFDGNSLGLPPESALKHAENALREWRELGIEGWTEADPPWFWYGERLGNKLAPLIGAHEDEVVVANTTTVNIHQLFATFYEPTRDRTKVVVDDLDFPTDHYAIRSQMRLHGLDPEKHLRVVESRDARTIGEVDIIDAIDDEVAVVFLPSVLYRSGQLLDLRRITEEAHEHGALAGFDIAHSVGVFPHELSDIGVDFAVWCGYKYLNGGPGATAGLYVNRRHFGTDPGLAGWWGHEKETQFDMNLTFTPAPDAGAWQISTVPVLSSAPLFGSLEMINEAGIERVREKSIQLTEYLISLVD